MTKKDYKEKHKAVNDLLTKLLETIELGSPIEFEATATELVEKKGGDGRKAGAEVDIRLKNGLPSINESYH